MQVEFPHALSQATEQEMIYTRLSVTGASHEFKLLGHHVQSQTLVWISFDRYANFGCILGQAISLVTGDLFQTVAFWMKASIGNDGGYLVCGKRIQYQLTIPEKHLQLEAEETAVINHAISCLRSVKSDDTMPRGYPFSPLRFFQPPRKQYMMNGRSRFCTMLPHVLICLRF